MSEPLPLPRLGESTTEVRTIVTAFNRLVETLEVRLATLEAPLVLPREPAAGEEVYDITNVTEDRTLDADSTTLAEVADVLGTLVQDLRNENKLR